MAIGYSHACGPNPGRYMKPYYHQPMPGTIEINATMRYTKPLTPNPTVASTVNRLLNYLYNSQWIRHQTP